MPYTDPGKNLMLNALAGTTPTTPITHAALFNGDPSGAGVEVSGGSPAYARKATAFGAASGGSMSGSAQIVFDVPAGAVVNYVGFFSASTGGTLLTYAAVTQETFGSQGTYTLTSDVLNLNG